MKDISSTGQEPPHVPIEPQDICSVVNEYVREAYKAGFEEIRLIHGRGNGTQRGTVQATLEWHPLVDTFRDAPESHLGATIATLRGLTINRHNLTAIPAPFNLQEVLRSKQSD